MEELELVEVTIKDLHVLRELSIHTFSEKFSEGNNKQDLYSYLESAFSKKQLSKELINKNSHFYFVKLGQLIVGYLKLNIGDAQIELKTENSAELERIYVLKSYQRKGIGHFLINFAIEWAVEYKLDFIWLGVWEKNDSAIRFYERHGFTAFGVHHFMVGTDKQTDVMMKLKLRE
ncbi:GNAT family N-acetyltransferase [Ascidiimonas sp. W6]|uniref:GNAT family N-acetyltransferase n=1 Tax=Ascidiimonas meishanensis TaxID=3128903 RepID=UPI0030ECBCBE